MNDEQLMTYAENFLKNKGIAYVKPGIIGQRLFNRIEIIYSVPETLDLNVIIDPPDVRVWVNTISGEVDLIHQM